MNFLFTQASVGLCP